MGEPELAAGPRRAGSRTELGDRKCVSALIVDDDSDTRDLLALLLTTAGYSVATANDGQAALDLMRTIRPELILLDIQMPQMNGAEFRQAQRRHPEWIRIPTIVMTGSKEEPVLDMGVTETLAKPFKGKTLLDLVRRYCSGPSSQ